jgi:hypothetical protein
VVTSLLSRTRPRSRVSVPTWISSSDRVMASSRPVASRS